MSRCDTAKRVLPIEAVLRLIAAWCTVGEEVAIATGAFDLAHAGHARALAAARAEADRLVVAVEDDETAFARLGPGRPVSNAIDRARIVAALRGVDAVVIVDESGPVRLREAAGALARVRVIDAALDAERWEALRRAGEPA